MKKLIYLLIIVALFSCQKANMKGFRIWNDAESNLIVYTAEKQHVITSKTSQFFMTETPKSELKYQFQDESLKVKVLDLNTDQYHIRVGSYLYDFRITVAGAADSAFIAINGQIFKEKLPFEYGTNSFYSYQAYVAPINGTGSTWVQIYINGTLSKRAECKDSEYCNLSGGIY